jgi:hypothetical protein
MRSLLMVYKESALDRHSGVVIYVTLHFVQVVIVGQIITVGNSQIEYMYFAVVRIQPIRNVA